MQSFEDWFKKKLEDPEVKKEYDALQYKFAKIQARINAGQRRKQKRKQK